MRYYEITYRYNGKAHTAEVFPSKGWEDQYHKSVLDRIESLVRAGAVVTDIIERT